MQITESDESPVGELNQSCSLSPITIVPTKEPFVFVCIFPLSPFRASCLRLHYNLVSGAVLIPGVVRSSFTTCSGGDVD